MTPMTADAHDTALTEAGDLLADAPADRPGRPARRIRLWIGLGLAALALAASALGAWVVERRHDQAVAETRQRLEVRADGKAEVLHAWLAGLTQLVGQLVTNDQVRLFATEVDMAEADDPLYGQLAPLAPYMTDALSEFVRQNPVAAAYLMGRDGHPILSSAGAAEITAAQRALARRTAATGEGRILSPLRAGDGGGAVFDLARPIPALQGPNPYAPPEAVGVLLVTVPAAERLAALLQPGDLALPGERTVLLQRPTDGPATAWVLSDTGLTQAPAAMEEVPDGAIPFAARPSRATDEAVFSAGIPLPDTPWAILQERDRAAALAPVGRIRLLAVIVGVLATAAIAGAAAALWFRIRGAHHRELAAQYRDMAGRIDAHRRLLTGVTDTVGELIGLKRRDGSYAYVNRALAEAVGRTPEGVIGRDDEALFGHATAERLAIADRAAWAGERPPPLEESRYLAGRPHHLETTRAPLLRADGMVDGIVSVSRDVTDLVQERARREASVRQTVEALVRTVELSDPYLAGHSRLLRDVGGLVARRLDLPAGDIATVEIAATLSQIGKPLVPRHILTKPERLTSDEIEVMQTHIVHAVRVLEDIDFDLPVRETVEQLYERLDGTGYPNGLAGEQVHLRARILGVCDWFCARIRPRSYRTAIAPEEALRVLAEHPGKYDPEVVAALGAVLATPEGEKLLALSDAA